MAAKVDLKPNVVDRLVGWANPEAGYKRLQARAGMAAASSYYGASKSRRPTKNWNVSGGDANADLVPDLPLLRERSRDQIRNNPLATGAINTKVTNIVGAGLKLHCRIDRDTLGMTDEQADEWEARTEREFRMWAECQDCSSARNANFYELQDLALRSTFENGDVFATLPMINRGNAYDLAVNMIEADRVANKDRATDSAKLVGGIQLDSHGAATHYHILKQHPGFSFSHKSDDWTVVPAYGAKGGRKNVIHLYRHLRVGQKRGAPDLAPVLEALKQLERYTEAELMAAVVSGMFTVFIKSESDLNPLNKGADGSHPVPKSGKGEFNLASGAILDLDAGETIETVNPGRPNSEFDPFVMSILRQVGVALELPLELLIKHFTASYSASRAALLEAWKFFIARRHWLADKFCMPIYQEFLVEAVSKGRINAPGFLDGDPAIRKAYLACDWIGPAKGHIQPKQEIEAELIHVELGTKTLDEVTAEATGGTWEQKIKQRGKEERLRKANGLMATGEKNSPFGGQPQVEEVTNEDNDLEDDSDDLKNGNKK